MKKRLVGKIRLTKETVRDLTPAALVNANGGVGATFTNKTSQAQGTCTLTCAVSCWYSTCDPCYQLKA